MPGRVRVKLARLPGTEDLPLPHYASEGAAGADLHAAVPDRLELRPGQRAVVPTGIRLALPPGYEAQVRPRSGLARKYGITLPNAPGTIDSDYRGEIQVLVWNTGTESFTIERGARVAQLVVAPVSRAEWQELGDLEDTGRGSGGFGSTGV